MTDIHYRLELLPNDEGREFYKTIMDRSNDNAGFDLFVSKDYTLSSATVTLLDLGCKARMIRCYPDEMEEEVHYWLAPRSSIWKSGVTMANSMGIIDHTYRGPLMGAVLPIAGLPAPEIKKGTRLFQILAPDMGWIKNILIVGSLNDTVRGEGGFGSTGQ